MGRDFTVLRLIGMRSPKTDSGFILPVAIGVGLVMILLGIIIINRSMQNRFTAIAQKQTSQSQAAAEAGIAQLQSLFNRYHPLATYCSSRALSPACNTNPKDWQNLSDADLEPNTCAATPITTTASDLVKDYADDATSNDWKLTSTNPDEGQFRLVSYTYTPKNTSSTPPTAPKGELIVEGRVRAATARLKVEFEITHPFPGLWISSNSQANASDSVQLKTNILDSTCSAATNASHVANLKTHMLDNSPPLPRYNYRVSPGAPFPALPLEGRNPPSIGIGSYSLPAIDSAQTLPRPGDIAQNGVLTYRVAQVAGQSIRLSRNTTLAVGSGNETVVLYLEGGLSLSDESKINLISGSKLIIYAHGPVTMSGDSATPLIHQVSVPPAASSNVQLYVYPPAPSASPAPPHNVQINSGAEILMVLFAPESEVTFNSSTAVKGMIWAKAWNGSQYAAIAESKPKLLDLKLIPPPRISPITSWERVSNP